MKLKKGNVIQLHVQVGVIGGHGLVVQLLVGNQAHQNQVNQDIGVGKWRAEEKNAATKNLNRVMDIYVVDQAQIYASKNKNAIVIQEEIRYNLYII